jgi:hypothetical protein
MLRRKDEGTLNPADFGIVPVIVTPSSRDHGVRVVLLVIAAVVTIYLMAFAATRLATLFSSCLLPPCY